MVSNDLDFDPDSYAHLLMPDVLERLREVAAALKEKGWQRSDIELLRCDISEPRIDYEKSVGGRYVVRMDVDAEALVAGEKKSGKREQVLVMARDEDGRWKLAETNASPMAVSSKPFRRIELSEEDKQAILELARMHLSLVCLDPTRVRYCLSKSTGILTILALCG